ncbi:MAG: hypothetical protein FJ109_10300 [Deltaproteobacteria bacterium]|nr:hypothetical protein [Deltaproteobacteria bacterium]
MTERRETTVSKCPACGAVTPGLPERCLACGHRFSEPGRSLPAMRDPTREMDTIVVRKRLDKRFLPRHVTVPFLAGLLVAVVVLVLLRLAASDHKLGLGGGAVETPGPSGREQGGGARSVQASGSQPPAGDFPALPHLGPGTQPVVPDDIRYFRQVQDAQQGAPPDTLRLDDLVDGSSGTCLRPGRAGLPGRIELTFRAYHRFSHVAFTVGCLEGPAAASTSRVTVETEGGIHRTVLLPAVEGPVTADLAGSWASRIVLRLDDPGLAALGLAEVQFFVFREDADAPES